MYEENRSSFSIMDVIFNLLFITLFVFILLWLFPSKSFLAENANNTNNGINALTNQIFNQNITTMKEASISYFTTPRLPKKVGDSSKLTLKEMRDKNLLLSLIDKNGNKCDENSSYVMITKMDDEYVLKVFLNCSDQEDYILVHLGCYDYCEGDVCEKEKEEEITYRYQYALTTACTWTGWSNWSDWSTTYVASNTSRKVETKVVSDKINASFTTKYVCPTGYTLNTSDKKCYKTTASTETVEATKNVTYTCPNNDYKLEGTMCVITTTREETVSAKANVSYTCPSGYTLNGTKCTKNTTIDATKNTSYTCPNGYTLSGTNCTKTTTATPETYVASKTCPSGYTDNGTNCSKEVTSTSVVASKTVTKNVCSTTNTLDCSSGTCKTVPSRTCKAVTSKTCPSGYSLAWGDNCAKSSTKTEYADYVITYATKCPNGGTGSNCALTTTIKATENVSYSCKDNTYTLSGTKCSKQETISATEKVEYSCEEGYTKVNETQCKREVSNTNKEQAKENISYSCKEAYVLNDNNACVKNTTVVDKKDSTIQTLYSCPNTYTLEGNVCTKKVTYYRFSTRSCNGGSVDYKWSLSNNDQDLIKQGYKLTGHKEIATGK